VVGDREAHARGDLPLPLLDALVAELRDPPAVYADDMIVMRALVELEDGAATLEVVTGHDPC